MLSLRKLTPEARRLSRWALRLSEKAKANVSRWSGSNLRSGDGILASASGLLWSSIRSCRCILNDVGRRFSVNNGISCLILKDVDDRAIGARNIWHDVLNNVR